MLNYMRLILNHPLNRDARFAAMFRWLRWQFSSRILPCEMLWPFVNNACLTVRPGMTGATGNVNTGLHGFVDMAFLLHYLLNDDLFIDAGLMSVPIPSGRWQPPSLCAAGIISKPHCILHQLSVC